MEFACSEQKRNVCYFIGMKQQLIKRLASPFINDLLEQFNVRTITAEQACETLGVGKKQALPDAGGVSPATAPKTRMGTRIIGRKPRATMATRSRSLPRKGVEGGVQLRLRRQRGAAKPRL